MACWSWSGSRTIVKYHGQLPGHRVRLPVVMPDVHVVFCNAEVWHDHRESEPNSSELQMAYLTLAHAYRFAVKVLGYRGKVLDHPSASHAPHLILVPFGLMLCVSNYTYGM